MSKNQSNSAAQLWAENLDKIEWLELSQNPSANALELLMQHPDKIHWLELSKNQSANALKLLMQNQDKVDWTALSSNPAIFTYDYAAMKENCLLFKEDLMKERFHPRNLPKFKSWGIDGYDSDSDEDLEEE
jgi:hypothetical protein